MARDGENRAEPPDVSSWGCHKPAAWEAGRGGLVPEEERSWEGKEGSKAARPEGGDWARAAAGDGG